MRGCCSATKQQQAAAWRRSSSIWHEAGLARLCWPLLWVCTEQTHPSRAPCHPARQAAHQPHTHGPGQSGAEATRTQKRQGMLGCKSSAVMCWRIEASSACPNPCTWHVSITFPRPDMAPSAAREQNKNDQMQQAVGRRTAKEDENKTRVGRVFVCSAFGAPSRECNTIPWRCKRGGTEW